MASDPSFDRALIVRIVGMLAVLGILAALCARSRPDEGSGRFNMLLAILAKRQNPQVRWLLRRGEELPKLIGRPVVRLKPVPDAINPLWAHHTGSAFK